MSRFQLADLATQSHDEVPHDGGKAQYIVMTLVEERHAFELPPWVHAIFSWRQGGSASLSATPQHSLQAG